MCDENRFLNRKCKSVFIRIELTDFLLDILGDGFIPTMAMDGEITEEAFRKKRERIRSGIESELDTIHILINNIADKIVLLRGTYDNPNPSQQRFCYQISAKIRRDNGKQDDYHFYSEAYWNGWVLITTLLNTIKQVERKFWNSELVDTNEAILFYIKEVFKTLRGYHECEPLNFDLREFFTAFEDELKNSDIQKSFFKYPFNAFSDYLKKTHYKLEDFFELWDMNEEAINDLRYREMKRRNWKRLCQMLYDPDYLLHEIEEENEILNLFDIEVEFTNLEKKEYNFVNETESTKKNFALKQQYRLFQARLFMAYLLNNIYAAMEKRGITAEQLKEVFAM